MDEEELLIILQVLEDVVQAEEEVAAPNRVVNRGDRNVDPFVHLMDDQFIKLFRVNKVLARRIIDMVTPYMDEGQTYSSLEIRTKVLVTILFYSHGSYQKITGQNMFFPMSQASVSRSIKEVTMALNHPAVINEWIHFPQNPDELQQLRARFFRKYNFPGIVGCIDCTHIAIVRPNVDEHIYVNRKQYHSLNVQLICDENLKIMNVVARFPGSAHDAHIWRQCNMSQIMETIYRENNQNNFFLLGDSGYPLRPWLLTPLRNTVPGTAEDRFNNHLKSVRSTIERCNGVLKNRWRCLLEHRVLHYSPHMSAHIITACCVLHNMCIDFNIPLDEMDLLDVNDGINNINEEVVAGNNVNEHLLAARRLQQQLINNYIVN